MLSYLQQLATALRTVTTPQLTHEELAAATEVARLATALTAPASTKADKAPDTIGLEAPAPPAPPSLETTRVRKPRRKARSRPARPRNTAAAAQRTIIIALDNETLGRGFSWRDMLQEHSAWVEGVRDTHNGNIGFVARHGVDVHALYLMLKDYAELYNAHAFLDGAWEDFVIHDTTYEPSSHEQEINDALADFHARLPQECKLTVQRITPLLPASERSKAQPHKGVSVRVQVMCPGLGKNLIREGITVGDRYCRVSRYKPRQPRSSPPHPHPLRLLLLDM
jgi:hypothetical protein